MKTIKHQIKNRIFIFFFLLPALHACNKDDVKMEQTPDL